MGKDERLADDLLVGAGAIAEFVFGVRNANTRQRIYYSATGKRSKGRRPPIWRQGAILCARKSELAAYYSASGQRKDVAERETQPAT